MNSLPKTDTRQRRDCDLNQCPSEPESSSLTTRLPSHPREGLLVNRAEGKRGDGKGGGQEFPPKVNVSKINTAKMRAYDGLFTVNVKQVK